jgi:hypothetical protein
VQPFETGDLVLPWREKDDFEYHALDAYWFESIGEERIDTAYRWIQWKRGSIGVVLGVFQLEYNNCTWLRVLCEGGIGWTNSKWTSKVKEVRNDD